MARCCQHTSAWHGMAQLAWHTRHGLSQPVVAQLALRGMALLAWHGLDKISLAQLSTLLQWILHALHPNLRPVPVPLAQPDPHTPSRPGAAQGEGCSTLPGGAPPCGAERGPRVPAEAAPCPCQPHVQTGAVLGLLVGQQCHPSLRGHHRLHTYFCVLQVLQPPAFKLF